MTPDSSHDLKATPVTSHDVARKAGVSRSVVSRAFTEGSRISEKSRAKVIAAANDLGYQVNYLARGLKTKHSNLVGIVAADLDTPFRARQVKVIAEECISHGFRPILLSAERTGEEDLISLLFSYNIAGMIVTTSTPSTAIISKCSRLSIPLVMINRGTNVKGADCVQIDVDQGGKLAFKMLASRGSRRLALLQPEEGSFSVTRRASAFLNICKQNDISTIRFLSKGHSYQCGHRMAAEIAVADEKIDGVFCVTDLLALGLLDGLRRDWGLNIPNDIQLVGFDDIEQGSWDSFQLSTIRQDADEQAIEAVKLMIDRIKQPDADQKTFSQKLVPIFRSTTRHLEL